MRQTAVRPVSREAFVGHVGVEMMTLVARLERMLGRRLHLEAQLLPAVHRLGEELEQPETRADAAYRLMGALYPHDEPPRAFWATEAGQLVALAIGYHRPEVPTMTAAAILNVTKQRIYQLAELGRLARVIGTGSISASSLRDHLAVYGRRR